MMQLRSTVNGINVGSLNAMSASIQNFSKAASGLNQVKTSDFTRMAKGIEKLSNIRKGELNRAATAITNISKAFSNIGNVSAGAEKIAQLAQGISRLGYKSTTQAIQNIPLLTTALKDMMTQLSQAPTVSQNLINMTNAMANLGAQAKGIQAVGNAMVNINNKGNGLVKRVADGVKNFAVHIYSASKHSRSFASVLGSLYANLFPLQRAFSGLSKAVMSSMDYIEEFNYFNTTMGKIASEWSEDYKKYGYKNAEVYGESFRNRLTEMMNKMTGFQMEDDGTLSDSGIKNIGLNPTQMTNYAAGVVQVTNSVGLTGEASVVTSKALSMLAGDMSSFRNLDMSTVMTNFSSGLIGQSRALYKYGIDITNATLATYAHELGIKKDITAMTQGEKMQLRMIAILEQSRVAWGDLAKTINSPSNQLRLLQNNFSSLSRTIGNMFLPVVAKVLPYVNGLVIAIRRLFEWTASMLGVDLGEVIGNSGSGYSDAFDGLEDDADDVSTAIGGVADSADKAAEAQKKLNKQLQGFDKLNNMTSSKGESSSDKNNGSADSKPIDLTSQLNAALADYEKVWNEAYENMENDAEKFADRLTKLFKDAWTSGDGSDIGSAIAKWLNKGIDWINKNWSIADGKMQKIAGIFATAINGLTYEFDWSGLGTALSNTLQTWLNGETTFFEKTDWKTLGEGIATSLNSFIGDGKKGPIQSYLGKLSAKLRSAIQLAFGTITTFKFDNLGKAIGQGINDFFDKMDKVDKKNGLNGWQELAKTISGGIKGIATTITTALETVEWEDVGQAIADFIAGVDWSDVVWNLWDAVKSFAKALKDTLKGAGMNDAFANLVVGVGIGNWIIKKISKKSLLKEIMKKLGNKFSTTLKEVGASVKDWSIKKWNKSALKTKLSEKVQGMSVSIKSAMASVKKWFVDEVSKSKAKSAMKGAVPSTVNKPVVNVSVGKYKVIGDLPESSIGTGKGTSLLTKIKNALGITGKSLKIGNILTSIMTALGSTNPSPATDDLVRKLETWFTNNVVKKVNFLDAAADMWDGLCVGLGKTINTVITTAADFISGVFEDTTAKTEGINVGNDMANGILKGFANALIFPAQFIYNLIVKPVKEALGIHSPSTVFKEIAKFCVEGFLGGFNLKKQIENKLAGLGKGAIDLTLNVKGFFDDKVEKIKNWWDGIRSNTKNLVVTAKGKIKEKWNDVKKAWNNFHEGVKTVWAKAKGAVDDKFKSVGKAWNSFKETTKELCAKAIGKIEDTWDRVQGAWENFKEGTKNIFVSATGTIQEGFESVSSKWNDFKEGTKNALIVAGGEIKKSFSSAWDKWKNFSASAKKNVKNVILNLLGNSNSSSYKTLKEKYDNFRSKTATLKAKAKEIGANVFKKIKSSWKDISEKTATLTATFKDFFTAPLKKAWNAIASAINRGLKIINKIPAVDIPMIPKLAKGGIFSGGSWHSIEKYASGGFPGMGQMFIAREAGPELVGTIGGHTAVMNNNQIVASVSDGVFNALAPVLTQVVNSINALNSKVNNMSGGMSVEKYTEGDLLRVVRKENNDFRKRTGRSAFSY